MRGDRQSKVNPRAHCDLWTWGRWRDFKHFQEKRGKNAVNELEFRHEKLYRRSKWGMFPETFLADNQPLNTKYSNLFPPNKKIWRLAGANAKWIIKYGYWHAFSWSPNQGCPWITTLGMADCSNIVHLIFSYFVYNIKW